ncbi:MAG: hypothetical protein GF421_08390 [Candidatus Aminicenantes bacterium]|nr:hypothetical protein [Candidatus Aminicenantes bacterium]
MPCNKADAVRWVRLKGQKMAIKRENTSMKNVRVILLKQILVYCRKEKDNENIAIFL